MLTDKNDSTYPSSAGCPRTWLRRANRVYAHHKGATDRLIAQRSAFDCGGRQDRFFWRSLQESCAYHFLHNSAYRDLCVQNGVRPTILDNDLKLGDIPYLEDLDEPATVTRTGSAEAIKIELQLSQGALPLDARSLRRLNRATLNIGHDLGLVSRERVNVVAVIGAKSRPDDPGQIWKHSLLSQFTQIRALALTAATDRGGMEFFSEMQRDGSALRLFSSFDDALLLVETLTNSSSPQLRFPKRSYAFVECTLSQRMKGDSLRASLAAVLGLEPSHVRLTCSIPQQVLPLIECEAGHLHLPSYMRVLGRNERGEIVPTQQSGRLEFFSPAISSGYSLAVLTKHRGHLEDGCPCGCRAKHIVVEE